jgi:hypothetical protein
MLRLTCRTLPPIPIVPNYTQGTGNWALCRNIITKEVAVVGLAVGLEVVTGAVLVEMVWTERLAAVLAMLDATYLGCRAMVMQSLQAHLVVKAMQTSTMLVCKGCKQHQHHPVVLAVSTGMAIAMVVAVVVVVVVVLMKRWTQHL